MLILYTSKAHDEVEAKLTYLQRIGVIDASHVR